MLYLSHYLPIIFLFILGTAMISALITTGYNTFGLRSMPKSSVTTTTHSASSATSSLSTPPQPSHDPSCSDIPNLWTHTYNHNRFTEYTPKCVTVKGKVLSVEVPGTKGGEADGDYHFNILADTAAYSNYHNCVTKPPPGKQCQELIAEIICYDHSAITLNDAKIACTNYKNQIYGPKVGEDVTVTGKWVQDFGIRGDHHYWNEIHPVTAIKK